MKQSIIFLVFIFSIMFIPLNQSYASGNATKLKGRILLQVESNGEAWYVNPENEKRYYLGRPEDAFQVMRNLGLGISNKDFSSFNGKAPSRLSGKILLKVEDNGKAYYVNPINLKMYFLGKPADAFQVMRNLGLGITNNDLGKILENGQTDTSNLKLPNNQEVSASELAPYLTGVVKIECGNTWGSGTLWDLSEKYENGNPRYLVLTNHHVIEDPQKNGSCIVDIREVNNLTFAGIYIVVPSGESIRTFNDDTDVAFLDLVDYPDLGDDPSFTQLLNNIKSVKPKNALNYKISYLPKCASSMPIGSSVIIIGYPASTQINEGYGVRTVTNGIISAYDSSVKKPVGNLPYENYFISAKIDSGNSGGIALSKNSDGKLCILGIPTWLNVGNYDTQGIIQNINNIYNKN